MSNNFLTEIPEFLSEISEKLLPWIARERQAQALALKTQEQVRYLNSLPPTPPESSSDDLLLVLNSTSLLLERLVEHAKSVQNHEATWEVGEAKAVPAARENQLITSSVHLPTAQNPTSNEPTAVAPPSLEIEPEPELSATAQELIKLRDWVLMAKNGAAAPTTTMLEALEQRLGKILAKEGAIAFEDTGAFNYERQQVISTQTTDDPDKNDWVCDTVRPGYLFHGKLVRPQEVIICTFDDSTSLAEDASS